MDSEIQTCENTEKNSTPENPTPAINNDPVNAVAEVINPSELLNTTPGKRGPGRPKGSKTKKNAENAPEPFISQIPGDALSAHVTDQAAEIPENATPPPAPVDYKAMALFIVTMGTGTAAKLIGPEWEPENETEKDFLVSAVGSYLAVKQSPDIPPGMMLAIVLAGYSAKRLSAPATQSFLQRAKLRAQQIALWIKTKTARKKAATKPFEFTPSVVQP